MMVVSGSVGFRHPADVAPIGESCLGYVRQKATHCLVIGAAGQVIAVEPLLSNSGKIGMWMTLPQMERRPDGLLMNFLWGRHRAPSKTRRAPNLRRRQAIDRARFEAYSTFHRAVLDGVTDTAVTAFLRCLASWSPDSTLKTLGWDSQDSANFVFRFQYDDEFLHERHAARLAWERAYRTLMGPAVSS